jgi:predicted phosphodiesterase
MEPRLVTITSIRKTPELLELRIPYAGFTETATFLLLSDIHLDNPKCDRKLLAKHLDECRAQNGHVLMFGDVLCLMQGKKDRRASKGDIRPEHLGGNYFDLVFSEAAEFFKPWQDIILMAGDGNHETAVSNNQEIDPLENVVRLMRNNGSNIEHMGYQGWIRFSFTQDNNSKTRRCMLFFHHGAWGGIVTKGVMAGGRYAAVAPDADVLVSGHNHERSVVAHSCYRVDQNGRAWVEQRWHVQCGTYKQEFGGTGGWAVERIVMPKSLGGIWLTLRPRNRGGVEITCTPTV